MTTKNEVLYFLKAMRDRYVYIKPTWPIEHQDAIDTIIKNLDKAIDYVNSN